MDKTVWFLKKDLLIGGTELLIERVSKEFIERGYNVNVICTSIMDEMIKRYENANINYILVSEWDNSKVLSFLKRERGIQMVVTFSVEDFCTVYGIRSKNIKTILYTVFFDQLLVGGKTKNSLALKYVKFITGKLLKQMMKKKKIVCMDEHTVNNTFNYYGKYLNYSKKEVPMLKIPVDLVDIDQSILLNKKDIDSKINILTIARADFPWKGYILGLIDFVNNYSGKNEITLRIVTYGEGEKLVIEKINCMSEEKKKLITLQGKTDYNELEKLYKDTNVYVGQGTTVLDAAQRGILTIPVVPDTYEVLSDAFFHENYERVTVEANIENRFEEMIAQVCNMDKDTYLYHAQEGRKAVVDNYGTKAICNSLLSLFDGMSTNSEKSIYVSAFLTLKRIKRYINSKNNKRMENV